MHAPAVVSWLLAALALGSGGYCLQRLRTSRSGCADGRRAGREVDGAEAVMALGMAGMVLLPGVLWGWLYAVLSAVLLLAATGPASRALRAHRLHHGIGALAMAYSALAMSGALGHPHDHATVGLPPLTGALLLYFGGYSLWTGSRLITVQGMTASAGALARACRAAMGIAMFAMLLTM